MVITLERLAQQRVDREPDRSPPVRVAAEQPGVRFRRDVLDPIFLAGAVEYIRMLAVDARERTDPIGRKELILIEQVAQHALQALTRRDRQQAPRVHLLLARVHVRYLPSKVR